MTSKGLKTRRRSAFRENEQADLCFAVLPGLFDFRKSHLKVKALIRLGFDDDSGSCRRTFVSQGNDMIAFLTPGRTACLVPSRFKDIVGFLYILLQESANCILELTAVTG